MAQVVSDRDPPITNHSDNPNKPNFGISSCILPSRMVQAAPYTHPKRKRKKNSGYRLMLEIVAEPINVRSMVHYEGAGKLKEVKTPSVTASASATTNVKPPKATSSYFKVLSDPSSSWPPAPGLATVATAQVNFMRVIVEHSRELYGGSESLRGVAWGLEIVAWSLHLLYVLYQSFSLCENGDQKRNYLETKVSKASYQPYRAETSSRTRSAVPFLLKTFDLLEEQDVGGDDGGKRNTVSWNVEGTGFIV
ncbi:hypothetical protein ACFX15_042110 [Malus domestica]